MEREAFVVNEWHAADSFAKRQRAELPRLRSLLLLLLFILFLISTYLHVPLALGGSFFIPAFLTTLFLLPLLAILYYNRMYRYELGLLTQVFYLLLLTALLSPGFEYIDQKFLGLLQTVLSLIGGVLLVKLVGDLPRQWVSRALLFMCIVLILGAFLEVTDVLRAASDSFRETVYSGTYGESGIYVYEADNRDVGITGFPRPKLFTSEPSYLAIGFFVFVNAWLTLAYSNKRLIATCLGTLIMFLLNGSPFLVLSLAVSLTIMLFHETRISRLTFAILAVWIMLLSLAYIQPTMVANLVSRMSDFYQSLSVENTSSLNQRVLWPYITAFDVLRHCPLFGVGISGKEVVERFSSLPYSSIQVLGHNCFAWLLVYTGFVGATLFFKFFYNYLRSVKVAHILPLTVLLIALANMLGGFETARFWGYAFLFIGVAKIAAEGKARHLTDDSLSDTENRSLQRDRAVYSRSSCDGQYA
jgi:hypothetical protein